MNTRRDGGWGWIITIGNLYVTAMFAASMRCYSVFYTPLMSEFDTSYGEISWINGSMQLAYGISCAIGSGLLQKYGIRPTVMICGLVASVSCFIGSQLSVLWQLQLCLGTIVGAALGPVMLGGFTIISRYFDKKLYTAMQVMCFGLSIGPFITCPFYQLLIDTFGWRGALQIVSGLYLNLSVCGALMRPIKLDTDIPKHTTKSHNFNNNNDLMMTPKQLRHLEKLAANTSDQFETSSSEGDQDIPLKVRDRKIVARLKDVEEGDYIASQTLSVVEVGGFKRRMQTRLFSRSSNRRKSSVYENAALLAKKIDLIVFTDPVFYIYSISWIGFAMSYFSTLIYLVPYGRQELGFNEMMSSSLVSAFAIGEITSRVFFGTLIDKLTHTQRLFFVSGCFVSLCAVLIIVPQITSYAGLLAMCAMIGILGGGMDAIFSALIVEMFGLELYSSAFGYSNIFIHAIGTLTTVLMGVAIDKTSGFAIVFYIGAASVFVAACSTQLLNYILTKRRRKNKS